MGLAENLPDLDVAKGERAVAPWVPAALMVLGAVALTGCGVVEPVVQTGADVAVGIGLTARGLYFESGEPGHVLLAGTVGGVVGIIKRIRGLSHEGNPVLDIADHALSWALAMVFLNNFNLVASQFSSLARSSSAGDGFGAGLMGGVGVLSGLQMLTEQNLGLLNYERWRDRVIAGFTGGVTAFLRAASNNEGGGEYATGLLSLAVGTGVAGFRWAYGRTSGRRLQAL